MAGQVRDQAPGVQEMLRTLAMLHQGFARDTARLELDLAIGLGYDVEAALTEMDDP
jgi:hypothetical protein